MCTTTTTTTSTTITTTTTTTAAAAAAAATTATSNYRCIPKKTHLTTISPSSPGLTSVPSAPTTLTVEQAKSS